MRWLRERIRQLHARLRGAPTDDELDAELRFHLEAEIAALESRGMARDDAERQARAHFGSLEAVKDECREERRFQPMAVVAQDTRFAFRIMRRDPLFSLTAIVSLALTVGAVAAVMTLGYTFLLRPLPVERPHEVVEVVATRDPGNQPGLFSYLDYVHFRDRGTRVADLAAAYPSAPLYVAIGDAARQVNGSVVSSGFFSMLGLEPAVGRFFTADEDAVPDRDRVVVLGHDYWQSAFAGQYDAVGSTLSINGTAFTVVGVAPAHFKGLTTAPADLYLPTMMLSLGYRWCEALSDPECTMLRVFGRLQAGERLESARAELAARAPERWSGAAPGDNSGVDVVPTGAGLGTGQTRLLGLFAASAVVLLLVCCANLAGLHLARSRARSQELAVRSALGAPNARLVRQMLTEAVVLAGCGGIAGLAVSRLLISVVATRFFTVDGSGRSLVWDFSLAPGIVGAALAISLLAGVAFGVLPAAAAVRGGGTASLKDLSRSVTGGSGLSRILLGGQAAAAVALIAVATLLAVGARELVRDANLQPESVVLMRLRPRLLAYDPAVAQRYVAEVVESLRGVAGVHSTSLVGTGIALYGLTAPVATPADAAATVAAGHLEIGTGYFETLRIPLIQGRDFDPADTTDSPPVAVVSTALAALLWPDGDVLGARLMVDGAEREVVGVVADTRLQSRAEEVRPYVYTSFWQNERAVDARLQVRVAGPASALIPTLMRTAAAVDPRVPITEVVTLDTRLAGIFRPLRIAASVVGYSAALAVALSVLGLYAAAAANVHRRRREVGIRQAIGATSRSVIGLIVGDNARVIAVGLIAGVGLAVASVRVLGGFLYGTSDADGAVFAFAVFLVGASAWLACRVPAGRAARIEPTEALRLD